MTGLKAAFVLAVIALSVPAFGQDTNIDAYKMTFTLSETVADVVLEIDAGNSNINSMSFRTDELDNFRVYDSKGPLEYRINETGDATVTQVLLRGGKFFLEFSSERFIFTSGDIKQFLADLSLEFPVESMQIVVKLPVGYITDSHFPKGADIVSDGSRIILAWEFENPSSALVSARFRKAEDLSLLPLLGGAVAAVAAGAGLLYYRRRSHQEFLQGFSEDETKVIECLRREKITYQNKVEKEFRFSRAKMTRIVKRLEEKGLLEKRRKGRTNRLKWIKGKAAGSPEKHKENHEGEKERSRAKDEKKRGRSEETKDERIVRDMFGDE